MQSLSHQVPSISKALLDEYRSASRGPIFAPGDVGYETACRGWNLSIAHHPALVHQVENEDDLQQAVRFARRALLPLAILSTGHGILAPADGCLLVVTSAMNAVEIDPAARSARVGAGAIWGQVLEKAHSLGLAPLLGSSPGVGAVGYTLGGGLGWLARKYGLSSDSVLAFDLVTMDGEIRRASPSENFDLFWGLRGGGGSFAIVSAMEIQLYPVEYVYGGTLVYPVSFVDEVLLRYRDWVPTYPPELTTSVKITNFPDMPIVPEPMRGQTFVMVNGCYCGEPAAGVAFFQDWFTWGKHLQNSFRVMPFSEVGTISNDPVDPLPSFSSGAWLRELSDNALQTISRFAVSRNGSSPLVFTEVRHVGGAMTSIPRVQKESAFSMRASPFIMHLISIAPTVESHTYLNDYVTQFKAAMRQDLNEGTYLNFLEGEESRQHTAEAFTGDAFQKLKALKTRYDPDNRLHTGFNIPPA